MRQNEDFDPGFPVKAGTDSHKPAGRVETTTSLLEQPDGEAAVVEPVDTARRREPPKNEG